MMAPSATSIAGAALSIKDRKVGEMAESLTRIVRAGKRTAGSCP